MTKLKKSLFLALLTIGVAMASCGDGDDESSKIIELTGGTQTTQTVFADETTLNNGIKFTATEAGQLLLLKWQPPKRLPGVWIGWN